MERDILCASTNASLIGNYVVTGTEANGKPYDGPGPLAVTMDKSGALELKWDGGKYVGIGQVIGNQVAVASAAEGKLVIGIMDIKPDGSLDDGGVAPIPAPRALKSGRRNSSR